MNFLKKNYKLIIGIIIGAILISGISVYATGQYLASQVDYNKNGQAKVSDALNDLYDIVNNYKYTEQEYLAYGTAQYNKSMADHNHFVDNNFTIKKGNNHYSIGFEPSVIYYHSSAGVAWALKGDSTLYWVGSGTSNVGTTPNMFSTDSTGFSFNYNSASDATGLIFYAVK